MGIYNYEEAFGAADVTSRAMRRAVGEWFSLYYDSQPDKDRDPCQRVAYTVVSKLVKTVFGEYKAVVGGPFAQQVLDALDQKRKEAMQLALVGGECYLKPCFGKDISFTVIPRDQVLIFGRDAHGEPVDLGTAERTVRGKFYYTLLERRSVDRDGYLTIRNSLFRSYSRENLGSRVALSTHPEYASLPECYTYEVPLGGVGLVRLKTPMVNCVDGSADGVSVYAPAVGLIRNIDRNEAQLCGEFDRGQSRIVVSSDMLSDQGLTDHVFVGLDEDPQSVGITVFSPVLREQSYIARKQQYLRDVESIVGLKRGMLSDSNEEERTATEIASSAGDYNLTVIDFQQVWEKAVRQALELGKCLGVLYRMPGAAEQERRPLRIDWGNGVLYDEDKTWEDYQKMVASGLLKPEIALGWRFGLAAETAQEQERVRKELMP